MTLERLKTDILILGSGGAGLFAALHAHQANPDARHHGREQGPARQMRLHAHGAGRLQRGAQPRRLGRAPLHGHDRGRQVAARPGARLDAGDARRSSACASWRTRSAASSTAIPDGTLHGKAFAGQTFDRTVHKGDLTGIEIINRLMEQVWARPIRRLEEHRAVALDPGEGRQPLAGVLMIDIRTGEFRFVAGAGGAARDRRRADHVSLSHAVRRQEHGRPRHGAARRACRCATWRWCSSIRPGCSPARTRA